MLNAHGWIIVRSSREKYKNISDEDSTYDLDNQTDKADNEIWDHLERFLKRMSVESCFLQTTFTKHLNNISGHLSILVSRNHTAPELYELIEWITVNAVGSYGIIYVHNNESEFANEFRIIRINRGEYSEHSDQLLSPLYPVVEYE